jgi:hypothetical protein
MARGQTFKAVEAIGRTLPDVEVTPDRDALVEDDPDVYYLKEHYLNYPCVVVRLSRISPDALRDLVVGAHRYVIGKTTRKSGAGAKGRRSPRSSQG